MSSVDQIKDKLSIEEVVSSYIKLERAGKNFKARCPFHNEKTPSFMVSPDRGTYHCFGCSRGGDIFSFVEEFEGTDFKGALKVLAARAGVELTPIDPKKKNERDRLFGALEAATTFFEHRLRKSETAQNYLTERGLQEKTVQEWRLGFIPDEWRLLKTHLEKQGYTETELIKVGLIKKSPKGGESYDTFRGRIMFPIFDSTGRVVGFSGRVFESDSEAKYLNSPEGPLFDKSRILYGLHQAKTEIRKYNFCILVEGQMDVLAAHQAGFANTVAIQGTAMTPEHAALLNRLTDNIVIALDADDAGVASAAKSTLQGLVRAMDVKVARLPKGSDPADLIQQAPESWKESVRKASHIVEFLTNIIREDESDLRKQKLRIRREVLPYIAHMDNKMDQAHFLTYLSRITEVPESALQDEMRKVADSLTMPEKMVETSAEGTPAEGTRSPADRIARILIGLLLWQEQVKEPEVDVSELRKEIQDLIGNDLYTLFSADAEEYAFEAEQLYGGAALKGSRELIQLLREHILKREFTETMRELKQAETSGDSSRALGLLQQCRDLSQQIEQLRVTDD